MKKNYTRIRFVTVCNHGGKQWAVGTYENDKMISFVPEHLAGDWQKLEQIAVTLSWFEMCAEHYGCKGEFDFR